MASLWVPKWTSAVHLSKWATRSSLKIAGVQVESLKSISRGDAISEWMPPTWSMEWSLVNSLPKSSNSLAVTKPQAHESGRSTSSTSKSHDNQH